MSQPNFRLDGNVAIVTGGSKGIGYALAKALAGSGAKVALCSRRGAEAEAAARSIASETGAETIAFVADVSRQADVQALVDGTVARFGRVDVLVNNAGTAVTKAAFDLTEEEWDRVVDVNLKGAFLCSQAAGRVMKENGGGRIINVASVMGVVGDVNIAPYCASKGGLVVLTKALAAEWARYNINVNAIGPGYVETDFNRDALADERVYNHVIRKTPMRRLGTEDELTGACLLLASDAGRYITGQTIFVDGGWTAI